MEGRRVRGALVCALVVLLCVACARPNNTVQVAPPTPSPSPTPTTPVALTATAPFHGGEVGVAYTPVALSATGGVQPYTWSISAGALPNGLTLGPDGTVSGNPTTAGNFGFTVQVADSGDSTATMPGAIPVAAALSASLIPACATQCSVELGCVNVCGPFGQVSGGVGPYTYTLTSGQLPAGTSLSALTLIGTFIGSSGYLKFSVRVTDSMGATTGVAPTFWMYDHISLASGTCSYGIMPCTVRLTYAGGTPNVSASMNVNGWSGGNCGYTAVVICPEPPILATVGGGSVSITIGPVGPNAYRNPTGTFTLSLTDQNLCGAGANCRSNAATLVLVWTG